MSSKATAKRPSSISEASRVSFSKSFARFAYVRICLNWVLANKQIPRQHEIPLFWAEMSLLF
jgi:hypothetical protein